MMCVVNFFALRFRFLKMSNWLLVILCLFSFFFSQIEISITFQDDVDIKNNNGVTLFRILDGDRIKLSNQFRNSSFLRLSLNGAVINKVQEQSKGSSWLLSLSDQSSAELSVLENNSLVEYYLIWHGGGPNVDREVCVHYGYNGASWYNTYQSNNLEWPLNISRVLARIHFNNLLEQHEVVTSEYMYILEHLYVNTDGFALLLDEHQPLFIRRDPNHGDPIMCFSVAAEVPYNDANPDPKYLDIKIRLFASTNIKTVLDYVVHKSGHIPKPSELPIVQKFTYPSVFFRTTIQEELVKQIGELEQNGFTNVELIHNNVCNKSDSICRFANRTNYPDIESIITNIYSKGMRLCVEAYPTANNEHRLSYKYFAHYRNDNQANVLDFTNTEAVDWYLSILKAFHYEEQIYSYLSFPTIYESLKLSNSSYPNEYYKNFIRSIVQTTGRNSSSWIAFRTQNFPILLQLETPGSLPFEKVLPMAIKNVLSLSIGGYSFLVPDRIGKQLPTKKEQIEEYLIRNVQAVALMPTFAFEGNLLWTNGPKLLNLSKKFAYFHTEHAPTIIELARKRVTEGSPIIRPLWYVAPDDPRTYKIADQFMLGNDILVAPVLVIGQRERIVYFPLGIWIDQHGKEFTGPDEIKIAAPLEELPYFKRKH